VVSARWPRRDSAKNKQKTPVGVATGASRYASQGTRDAFLRYLLSILSAILRGQVLVRARLAVDDEAEGLDLCLEATGKRLEVQSTGFSNVRSRR
jgi:hypothetical protein